MKYYKVIDGEFLGFYDREVHGNIVDRKEFHAISDELWMELLNGQSEGNKIRILKNGKLGLYRVPILEEDMIKPQFNYDKEIWEETATEDEQLQHWEDMIISNQYEISVRQKAGFRPTKEQLRLKEVYLQKHIDICMDLAIKMKNGL